MSPAPQDSVICKATGRDSCLGVTNLVRECIPAAVVEDRPGARGWYCAAHGGEVMDRRAKRRAAWEESHARCCMCGGKMRANRVTTIVEGPDPISLDFCDVSCARRWERTHPL